MKYDDPEILAHEQSHFDMGEAYARKCRQFLTSLAGKKTSYNELDSTIKLLYSQLIQSESLYDKETSNGINRVEQARWDLRIQKMLDSLADYKSPDGDVMLK